MRTPLLFGMFSCLLLAAGAPGSALATERQLASGRIVEIDSLGAVRQEGEPMLVVKYRSTLPIQDKDALRREADEVWQYLATNADCGPYDKAMLTVTGRPDGSGAFASQDFVFDRGRIGWHTEEAGDVAKLDEDFIKRFMARLDDDDRRGEGDAKLLYIDDDYSITIIDESDDGAVRSQKSRKRRSAEQGITLHRADADQMVRLDRVVAAGSSDRHATRDILKITLSPDGQRASVESRRTLDYVFNSRHYTAVERATDVIELREKQVVVTKSDLAIEQKTDTDLLFGSPSTPTEGAGASSRL